MDRAQDPRHVRVEAEFLPRCVAYDQAFIVVGRAQGRHYVGVDPEWPEGVVEIEDDHAWEGTGVGEGLGEWD